MNDMDELIWLGNEIISLINIAIIFWFDIIKIFKYNAQLIKISVIII